MEGIKILVACIFISTLSSTSCATASAPIIVPPIIGEKGSCYSNQEVEERAGKLVQEVLRLQAVPDCGEGLWKQVVVLNLSNTLQDCPSGWSLRSNPRSCSQTQAPGCSLVTFPADTTYNDVCGRAVGAASGSNDAFMDWSPSRTGLNYADGVNVFLSTATPQHVWTFATDQSFYGLPRCPCSNNTGYDFPDFVDSHYFCDTHEANNTGIWDGEGCNAATCCDYNNPPWFHVSFSSSFTSDIQVRICTDEDFNNEVVSLVELELYVQ